MNSLIRKIFFGGDKITTFMIARLRENEIEETVWLAAGNTTIDITKNQGMICLDPFCITVWLPATQKSILQNDKIKLSFRKGIAVNATIAVSLIESISTDNGLLLLLKVVKSDNFQLNAVHRLVLFNYLLRSPKNTCQSRKTISALYAYPRSIIIVSYQDKNYYNIFPMDIHSNIEQEGLYVLGLRTTNATLDKILEQKKIVVCDTDSADINTVYDLGKHPSKSPPPKAELNFNTVESEMFGFPVPDFCASYKEIEIVQHRLMGFHMFILGRVVNYKKTKATPASFYHISFLQFQKSNYKGIEATY